MLLEMQPRRRKGAESTRANTFHKLPVFFVTLRLCVFVFVLLLLASVSFAMTIYFKDGTTREVHKIVFNGTSAELYLVDGTIMHVPVDTLDLRSSGIGAPVGTYGTSTMNGQRSMTGRSTSLGDPKRQARLKEEWDQSDRTAVAVKTIGAIKQGDTIKIVGETSAKTAPAYDEDYDPSEYWYDSESQRYQFRQQNMDHAFIIVYKNPDGTYGKRLIDAATFQFSFKTNQIAKGPKPMPEYPVIPDRAEPGPHATPPPPAPTESIETKPETQTQPADQQSTPVPPASQKNESRRWIAFSVFVGVLVLLGFAAWFVIQRMQRPYIDTSKFKRYEEDLREFEIAIWLRNGKTPDQLMEICVKKFYQDHPAALAICNKMLKGGQKGLLLPFITGQTGKSSAEASAIYDQIHSQIDTIRKLIHDVSQKTGFSPVKPAPVETTQKPAAPPSPPPMPKSAPVAPPVVTDVAKQSSPRLIEPDTPMRSGSDLPSYASSVLNQITFLSSKEEK